MKKIVMMIGAGLFASVLLTSCGNDHAAAIEEDAIEVASLQCDAMGLFSRLGEGDASAQDELMDLSERMDELTEEILEKYTSQEDQDAFNEAFKTDLRNNCELMEGIEDSPEFVAFDFFAEIEPAPEMEMDAEDFDFNGEDMDFDYDEGDFELSEEEIQELEELLSE